MSAPHDWPPRLALLLIQVRAEFGIGPHDVSSKLPRPPHGRRRVKVCNLVKHIQRHICQRVNVNVNVSRDVLLTM